MQMPSESRLHKGAPIYDVCTGGGRGSPKNSVKTDFSPAEPPAYYPANPPAVAKHPVRAGGSA